MKKNKVIALLSLAGSLLSGAALALSGQPVEGLGIISASFATGFAAWQRGEF